MNPTPSIIVEDIEFALQFVESKLNPLFPIRGAFQSQLYCVIKNRSDVDEGVNRLRENKSIKLISCKHCGVDDIFVIRSSSYVQDIESYFSSYIQSLIDLPACHAKSSTTSSSSRRSSSESESKIRSQAVNACKDKFLSFISCTSYMSVSTDNLLDH